MRISDWSSDVCSSDLQRQYNDGRELGVTSRPLTEAERNLAASIFGDAIDYSAVRIRHRRWWPFQPRRVTMAPDGHIWFPPKGGLWCEDFCDRSLQAQIGRASCRERVCQSV